MIDETHCLAFCNFTSGFQFFRIYLVEEIKDEGERKETVSRSRSPPPPSFLSFALSFKAVKD